MLSNEEVGSLINLSINGLIQTNQISLFEQEEAQEVVFPKQTHPGSNSVN